MEPIATFIRRSTGSRRNGMRERARQRGFSLIEMMMALFILAVSILGLTAVTIKSMQVNVGNDLRNTAIRLANQKVEDLTAQPIDDITTDSVTEDIRLRNGAITKSFTTGWNVTPQTHDLKQIVIIVSYDFGGHSNLYKTVLFKHRAI